MDEDDVDGVILKGIKLKNHFKFLNLIGTWRIRLFLDTDNE